jgi:hypothetical protein
VKKFIVVLAIIGLLFTIGCSTRWYEHDTIYKTNDHLAYSLWGYNNCDELGDYKALQNEQGGWWGDDCLECSK